MKTDLARLQSGDHGFLVNYSASCRVNQYRPIFHLVELSLSKRSSSVFIQGHIDRDDIGLSE